MILVCSEYKLKRINLYISLLSSQSGALMEERDFFLFQFLQPTTFETMQWPIQGGPGGFTLQPISSRTILVVYL